MTTAAAASFRRRILTKRTETLAGRGRRQAADRLADRLVCATGERLYGIEPALVLAVRPQSFHPLPLIVGSATRAMLGVTVHGGRLHSVLDLARLLGDPADGIVGEVGAMLLLSWNDRRVALRVDHVLGLVGLRQAGADGGLGILDDEAGPPVASAGAPDALPGGAPGSVLERQGRLVALIDQPRLRDRIALLDQPSAPADHPAPTGA